MADNHILLESIELTQTASSITFDNLPTSGYTDLKVVHSIRLSNTSNVVDDIALALNGVTTTFTMKRYFGSGSAASSDSGGSPNNYVGIAPNSSATASTFGNGEFYITDYRSSGNKSISCDTVSENNATASYIMVTSLLWSNVNPITSFTLTGYASNFLAGSTVSLYGVSTLGVTPEVAPLASGGNIIANDGTYWYHAFLSSGTFTPAKALSCDYLVIAGGGGGGWGSGAVGAGGGAGGLRAITATTLLANTNYATTVGGGGAGRGTAGSGTNGSNSVFNSITSTGGGGGGGGSASGVGLQGNSGGSGGGSNGWDFVGTRAGGLGNTPSTSPSQGNDGGSHTGNGSNRSGGGGGGAGGVGGASNIGSGGTGGAGLNTITGYGSFSATATATNTGVSSFYAGGGGGSGDSPTSDRAGGSGGGGTGGYFAPSTKNGVASTGSGGGGVGDGTAGQSSGNGASGIVIIRYPMSS